MTERTAMEDFWGQVDRQIDQHISDNAVKQIQVQVTAVRSVDQYVDVLRPGNVASDGVYYPVIAPAYKPTVGDWVWAQVTQGGLLIMGKNREQGDMDIPAAVNEAAQDATAKANDARADAKAAAQTYANQAENDAKNYADEYKASKGHHHDTDYAFKSHGHGTHSHSSVGGHTHSYGYYDGATWESATWRTGNTGSGGSHGHGSSGV